MIGLATPLPAYSEARAGGLRDLGLRDSESPSRSIVRELVQATRAEADKLFERIVSVEDGIKDARIIHQVANTAAAKTKRLRSLIRNVSPDSPRVGETFNNIINHFSDLQ